MSEFDKVIGFEVIKNELMQICDMLHNREKYEALGAKLPSGVLLLGEPGTGKTLLSTCFIKESGMTAYPLRKTKDNFAEEITATFERAKANAPSIVFLDDMDKFANGNSINKNSSEYVAIQSGIDSCKGKDVFVIGTVNNVFYLPDSLVREGRFDRKYNLDNPNPEDAEKIIKHYLEAKKILPETNIEDVTKLFLAKTCAEIDVILNDAAIRAAYAGKSAMDIDDIKAAFLRVHYDSPDFYFESDDEERLRKVALHEAGHLVMCEVLCPKSVSIASVSERRIGVKGGFVEQSHHEDDLIKNTMIALAGKAATEMCFADDYTDGCSSDVTRAYMTAFSAVKNHALVGLRNVGTNGSGSAIADQFVSEDYKAVLDIQVHAELERAMNRTRDILFRNRELLFAYADALREKRTLLYSDIQALKEAS